MMMLILIVVFIAEQYICDVFFLLNDFVFNVLCHTVMIE